MKMNVPSFKKGAAFAVVLGLIGLAGCSTPQTRIQKNPELFSSLSAEDQQTIKEGRVALGFTAEMTKLALGDPDRVTTRTDSGGTSEVWRYTTYESDDGMYLFRGYYHRYYTYGDPFFPYYLNYSSRRERDYLKITFTDGRISSIEQDR
jgi:hypothetical protein